MAETGPQHSFTFREEVLEKIFYLINSRESGCVISAAGMGKSRLIDHLLRPEVLQHYLGKKAESTILIPIDVNLLGEWSIWGFFELMLNSIVESSIRYEHLNNVQEQLIELESKVLRDRNDVLALRFLQLAINSLCEKYQYNLCFVFDEFDLGYRQLPDQLFTYLRGIRNKNKQSLSYILFLRDFPSRIRPPADILNFYELISKNMIGLGPYNQSDSIVVIQQVEARRNYSFTSVQREKIFSLSGGHPGIILALFYVVCENGSLLEPDIEVNKIATLPTIVEANRRIWESLLDQEKFGIIEFIQGASDKNSYEIKLLRTKGIVQRQEDGTENIFSPVFRAFVEAAINIDDNKKGDELLPKRSLKVFLCHASGDKPFVRKLHKRILDINGVSPWLDEVNLIPGDDWKIVINQEIKKTDLLIVCLSRKSITKEGFVQKEIKLALDFADEKPEGQLFIIPLKFEECNVPARLAKYHWLNYFDEDAFNKLFLALKTRAEYLGINIETDRN